MATSLFGAMATGGLVGFEPVAWFDGGLFDDDTALALKKPEIEIALRAAALDWSEIDPSILGILFERGLDREKRAQLGAHYTDRDKIMLVVEPMVVRPLLAEWQTAKAEIAASLERSEAARSRAAQTRHRGEPSGCWPTSSNGCAVSPCSVPPAAPGTSSASLSMRSRTWSTACCWRPRRWACSGPFRWWVRRTSRESRSTDQRLRGGACPRIGVDRRDPVDAAQRVRRIAQADVVIGTPSFSAATRSRSNRHFYLYPTMVAIAPLLGIRIVKCLRLHRRIKVLGGKYIVNLMAGRLRTLSSVVVCGHISAGAWHTACW